MKKVLFVGCVCLALSLGFVLVGCGPSESEGKSGPQTTCPVMGNKIDEKIYVDYKGKRVYFCCAGCPKMFQADPEKHMQKLADEGVILEDAPK